MKSPIRTLLWSILSLGPTSLWAATGPEALQITFGTRSPPGEPSAVADLGDHLVEAENGDIVVAGYGASYYSDTGQRSKPLIARFSRDGRMIYQRILEGFENYRVEDLHAGPTGEPRVVLSAPKGQRAGSVTEQTIHLFTIDDGGSTKRTLAGSVNPRDPWSSMRSADDATADLILTSLPTALAETHARSLIRRRFEVAASGEWQPRYAPNPRSTHLWLTGEGDVVYRQGRPAGIRRVNASGHIASVLTFGKEQSRSQVAMADDRIFVVDPPSRRSGGHALVHAYSMEGQLMWRQYLGPIEGFLRPLPLRDGGLLVAGAYEGSPAVARFDRDGRISWYERFQSTKLVTRINAVLELRDGSIALTGQTGPSEYADSPSDDDGFLIVTDANGEDLRTIQPCLVDTQRLTSLRQELEALTGIRVTRHATYRSRPDIVQASLPPLHVPVRLSDRCAPVSETHLFAFLTQALASARALSLERPYENAFMTVMVLPESVFSGQTAPYRDDHRLSGGPSAALLAGHLSAHATVSYLAGEIAPFLALMRDAARGLREQLDWPLRAADNYSIAGGEAPFGERAQVANAAVQQFVSLDSEAQTSVRTLYADYSFAVSRHPDVLHVWGSSRIIVGRDRVADLFPYLLALPELSAEIERASTQLLETLNIKVYRRDISVLHTTYLNSLVRLLRLADGLSEAQLRGVRAAAVGLLVAPALSAQVMLDGEQRRLRMRPGAEMELLELVLSKQTALAQQAPRHE
ncbi:MAG: hypothetical protein AAGA68_23095 [Pseudomonadota bacterium]